MSSINAKLIILAVATVMCSELLMGVTVSAEEDPLRTNNFAVLGRRSTGDMNSTAENLGSLFKDSFNSSQSVPLNVTAANQMANDTGEW